MIIDLWIKNLPVGENSQREVRKISHDIYPLLWSLNNFKCENGNLKLWHEFIDGSILILNTRAN